MSRPARRTATSGAPALTAVIGLVLAFASPATARVRDLHLRYGPIDLQPAELEAHNSRVPAPRVKGFITRMHAYVVDERGRPLATNEVMLHHAVFRKDITPYYDAGCQARRHTEPFYATGEEDETLRLPRGYGLRTKRADRWLVRWMLMNHTNNRYKAYIRYDLRVDTSRRIVPVRAVWMRVVNCRTEHFDVPGNGGPGSVFELSRELTVSRTGRIVLATGHLHGGAIGLTLFEPRCGNRSLFTARPIYRGGPVKAHDGPVHVTSFTSPVGIPVFRGQQLVLTAAYDNSLPRHDVMGTMHLYVARGRPTALDCGPLPPSSR
jgi:hypothetical protein